MATVNPNELVTQAMVGTMAVSVVGTALGILATSSAFPGAIPATGRGIADLRVTFGGDLVDIAIKNVGKDDMLILANEVGDLYVARMKKKYGVWQTEQALDSAPPGDLRTAKEIAAALAGQSVTPTSSPEKVEKAVNTGRKRGRRKAQPMKDTKTGTVYQSKAKAGMAVAEEYGLNSKNHFAWYEVIKKDPTRFVPA